MGQKRRAGRAQTNYTSILLVDSLPYQLLVYSVTIHSTDVIGKTIPLSGTFENKNIDILSTLGGILKNAFIQALLPGIDRTISLKQVQAK